MAAQRCECPKCHSTVYFKMVNFMFHKFSLNKNIFYKRDRNRDLDIEIETEIDRDIKRW